MPRLSAISFAVRMASREKALTDSCASMRPKARILVAEISETSSPAPLRALCGNRTAKERFVVSLNLFSFACNMHAWRQHREAFPVQTPFRFFTDCVIGVLEQLHFYSIDS